MALSVKQKKVIEQLFEGIAEDELFDKATLPRSLFRTWLSQKEFVDAIESRVASAAVRSQMMVARYSAFAVARLINLTESKNGETARKACLDILQLLAKFRATPAESFPLRRPSTARDRLSPEQQSRMLGALAGDKTQGPTAQGKGGNKRSGKVTDEK